MTYTRHAGLTDLTLVSSLLSQIFSKPTTVLRSPEFGLFPDTPLDIFGTVTVPGYEAA